MVTGAGPQSKVMIPPAATAATTALDVQPAGVPLPITLVGLLVSTGFAAAGTLARPLGLPAANRFTGAVVGAAFVVGAASVAGTGVPAPEVPAPDVGGDPAAGVSASPEHPPSAPANRTQTTTAVRRDASIRQIVVTRGAPRTDRRVKPRRLPLVPDPVREGP
ncbi:hypothetical protein GCM10009681_34200 [Luedemannella helvata]|uniref:Uncharacterized protein n=1 Tax=Luedemannella helvata TaxID=349315 RepID=A0ABN2KMD8_9ACTN